MHSGLVYFQSLILFLDAPFATDTIYAGLQLVMANEVGPAQRHTAFAIRFIIGGNSGFTAIRGRRIKMQRGDIILTPKWNWHDHGKDGSGPMIWLDGLDLPNFLLFLPNILLILATQQMMWTPRPQL
jgi:gentisate 1,2-dioxygenase